MSGPLDAVDSTTEATATTAEPPSVEVTDGREAVVGTTTVRRVLPRRTRRTVGAWCFADHMGPEQVTETGGLDIGPHPHMGLHTVTWLVEGAVLHRDSLGSEQLIRPGQLNLMTAGNGIAHAEEHVRTYRGTMHGVQLWVAQPTETRNGEPAFTHHAELPRAEVGGAVATVLIGELAGVVSPARQDTPLVGADLAIQPGVTTWPLRADFEHALVVLDGEVAVGEQVVRPGQLGYLGLGRESLELAALSPSRVLLLGGVPFEEKLAMWWNFVGRTKEELAQARTQWATYDERFGEVTSALPRISAPPAL
jgi:redox-sensitive bicupin YhaK (pirin superfamily)